MFTSVYNKKTIIKFFLSGLALFSLSLIYVVLRDTSAVTAAVLPLPFLTFIKMTSLSFFVKLVLLGLFFLVYRRDNLPQILFVGTLSLLTICIIFHFWGFQQANPWIHSAYYLLADIWEAFTITFLFWAFANQIFTLKEAKLAYPLLMFIFPSLGSLLGGASITTIGGNFQEIMRPLGFVLLGGLILFVVAAWLIKKNKLTELVPLVAENSEPTKMTNLFKWTYLFHIFVIVTCLGSCWQLINLLFKSQLKGLFPSPEIYSTFIGQYSTYTLWGSGLIFSLTFWVIWKFGWLKSALVPPVYLLISTCLLLLYFYFPSVQSLVGNPLERDFSPFFLLISLQFILFKGFYILFLATKEMAYIPLPIATKVWGKSIIDFLFLGFGAWLGIIFFELFYRGPMNPTTEDILFIVLGTTIIWIISVVYLGKMFKSISRE